MAASNVGHMLLVDDKGSSRDKTRALSGLLLMWKILFKGLNAKDLAASRTNFALTVSCRLNRSSG